MTPPEPGTRHVVDRCPSCGVEHDTRTGGACEACHTPLRAWCSRHGRETGWLDGPTCPRCADEAACPAPPPRPRRPARPRPSVPPASAPEPPRSAPSPWPGRSPREILREAPEEGVVAGRRQPKRWGFALLDTLGLTIGGAVVGIAAGAFVSTLSGAETAAGAQAGVWVMGLGGLAVGLIRTAAIYAHERSRDGD